MCYRLFLENDLFRALPALYTVYSDGFMEYTYNADHSIFHFFMNKTKLINLCKIVISKFYAIILQYTI